MRVTERAAVAAARLRGRGDEMAADQAAVNAMRRELNRLAIDGTVVIGEGERDEAPMLYIGEEVGTRNGPKVDIALDPLEGTTICAKNLPNALAVIAIAETGSLLNAPDVYMDKIAIGPGYPAGVVDLDRSPTENIRALAAAKGRAGERDRGLRPRPAAPRQADRGTPRHRRCHPPDRRRRRRRRHPHDRAGETGIDIYLGIGGAPEGVLAAAALRCMGGQMQGRLVIATDEQRERAKRMGVTDVQRKYDMTDMARGDVLFAATGVTDGNLLAGVQFGRRSITTHTVVMRASSGTVRWIKAEHQDLEKFDILT